MFWVLSVSALGSGLGEEHLGCRGQSVGARSSAAPQPPPQSVEGGRLNVQGLGSGVHGVVLQG